MMRKNFKKFIRLNFRLHSFFHFFFKVVSEFFPTGLYLSQPYLRLICYNIVIQKINILFRMCLDISYIRYKPT